MKHWLISPFTALRALFAAAIFAFVFSTPVRAEVFTQTYTTTQCQDYELITEMLIGPGVARRPKGAKIDQTSNVQVGIFSNLVAKVIPSFTNGVILSTGMIADGSSLTNSSSAYEWPNDELPDLGEDNDMADYFPDDTLYNPAGIVLYIQPRNKTINIPFLMASEEFYYDSDSPDEPSQEDYEDYSDKFAFFLKEIADASEPAAYDKDGNVIDDGLPMEHNIAIFNDGKDVEIMSVNQHTNKDYFISNVATNESGDLEFPTNNLALPMEFNGAIVGPVAVATNLNPQKIYKLKIIIADSGDMRMNSAVFLRARGITSGADLKLDAFGPASLSIPGQVTFTNTLSNIGPAPADGVVVTNWLPAGVSVATPASDVGSISAMQTMGTTNYFVWTLGDRFASGSNAVMTIQCELPAKGVYTNLASVVTSTGDYDPSNDTDDHVVVVGELYEPKMVLTAISTNKCYGETINLKKDLDFVWKIEMDGTNGTERVDGVTVTFTNSAALGVEAYPTNVAAAVGTYGIYLSNVRGEHIDAFADRITLNAGTLTVTQRCVTVTADNTNKVYGTKIDLAQDAFKITAGGLADGETITSVTLTSTNNVAGNATVSVGVYVGEIEPSAPQGEGGFDSDNYDITFVNGTLEVTKATLAVSAPNIVKVYDGTGTNVTAAIDGGEPEDHKATYLYSTDPNGPYVEWQDLQYTNVVFDGAAVTSNKVWYRISTEPEDYFAATNYAWVTITQRCVTVKAADATKKPGTPDPKSFAWDVENAAKTIVAGETAAVYAALTNDIGVSGKLYRTPDGETKGDYAITTNAPFAALTTGVLANYALAFTPGTLTITEQTPLTFYIASTSVVYGAEIPTGFAFDRTDPETYDPAMIPRLNEVTFGTDYAKGSAVGGYTITTNNDALASVYYAITVVPGTLTVTQRCVTVKSESAKKVYDGTPLSTNEVKVVAGSFADGEGVEGDGFASITDVGKKENAFSVKPKEGTATSLGNYALVQTNGTLEVTPAPILPVKPGETPPTDPTKAWTSVENVIKCYDGLGTNIWPTSGNFVAGNEPTYRYGTSETGPFDFEWKDLQFTNVVFDAYGNVTSNPVWYVVTTKKGDAVNYFAATNSAYVMITQRCVTVTADSTNKVYGTEITFTGTEFTAVGLTNDETIATVTLTSGGTDKTAAVKEYDITASDPVFGKGLASNYQFTFKPGTLTVTKATLAVAAPNIVKVYDGAGTNVTAAITGDQPLEGNVPTYLYSTAQNGPYVEWQNLQYTNVVFTEGAVSSNRVWYKVSTDPENYFAATNWAWITITQRPLTVRADDATKKPGMPDPDPFVWSVVDPEKAIVAGEETDVYTALTNDVGVSDKLYRTPDGEAKGDYTITTNKPFAALTTGVLANYALAFTPGTLTITDKEPLTFYVASTNVAYGADVPTGFSFDHTDPATYDSDKITGLDKVQFKTTYYKKAPVSGSPYAITTNNVLSSDAYAIAVVPGTLTVTQRCVTITGASATKVYDGVALSNVTVTVTGFITGEGIVTNNFATLTDVGKAENKFDYSKKEGTDFANYALPTAPAYGELEVTPAPILPVKPGETPPTDPTKAWTSVENVIKCYDGLGTNIWPTSGNFVAGNEPTYRYGTSETGPFDREWKDLQFTNVVFDAYGNVTSNPVWYVVTTKKGDAVNYFAATNSAYVMITQRCVTVTADSTNKVYGTEITFTGTEFTAVGLTNDETIASVTLTSDGTDKTAAVKEYDITATDPVFGKGLASNYQFTFKPGTLTVTKASLAVAAPNIVKVYDGAGTNVTAAITGDQPLEGNVPTYLYSTAQNGPYVEWQNLQYTNVVFTEGAVSSNQVWYKVSTDPENYFAATNWAWITITQRCVTVKAADATKKPGTPDPKPFAWDVENAAKTIVAGETAAVYAALTNDIVVSDKLYRTPDGETTGDYAITTNAPFAALPAGVLANYALAFTPGTLKITEQTPLTFYIASTSVVYGAEIPAGFGFGRTDPETYDPTMIPRLNEVTFGTDCAKGSAVGGYTITTNNDALASVYYAITVVPGTLTVTQRCVTVKSESAKKVYDGTPLSTNEVKVVAGSFADGEGVECDGFASITDVGKKENTFSVKPKEGTATSLGNYALVQTNGTLEVTRAPILPVKPGEEPPTDPTKAWTQAANIIKCYDGLGTNIWPEASVVPGNVASYLFSTNAAGPFVAWENLQLTNVVFDVDGNVTSNQIYYTITTDKAGIENYFAATNYAYVVITQAMLTVEVNDAVWKAGKAKPTYTLKDFTDKLAVGDTVADVTGGTETYSNKVWETAVPAKEDKGTYVDEIWLKIESLTGAKRTNYTIEALPGDLEIKAGESKLTTSVAATINRTTGLEDFTITVVNDGDGEVDPAYDYWVELQPGPSADGSASGRRVHYERTFFLTNAANAALVKQMPDGYLYQDLTAKVKAALRKVGNLDEVFDPGETVSVSGVSAYHWKRWTPAKFIDMESFFVAGRLLNPSDTDRDFRISESEKSAAEGLLGTSSDDYLEVTRLQLLPYYHWNSEAGTWK